MGLRKRTCPQGYELNPLTLKPPDVMDWGTCLPGVVCSDIPIRYISRFKGFKVLRFGCVRDSGLAFLLEGRAAQSGIIPQVREFAFVSLIWGVSNQSAIDAHTRLECC